MTRPSAPRGYAPKTGKGRQTRAPKAVREVETQPCPATLGSECHELSNTPAGVTRCIWCRETWGALDAELRAS